MMKKSMTDVDVYVFKKMFCVIGLGKNPNLAYRAPFGKFGKCEIIQSELIDLINKIIKYGVDFDVDHGKNWKEFVKIAHARSNKEFYNNCFMVNIHFSEAEDDRFKVSVWEQKQEGRGLVPRGVSSPGTIDSAAALAMELHAKRFGAQAE